MSKVRDGKLIGSENFTLDRLNESDLAEDLLRAFLTQYYSNSRTIPPLVLMPTEIEDRIVIEKWLGRLRNTKVMLKVPKRGNKVAMIEMASANAQHALAMSVVKHSWEKDSSERTLKELAKALSLESIPERIECFDISTIQGSNSVGSMVVFISGKPAKSDYRKFKIRYDEGINDFAMMHEVVSRRFGHMRDGLDRSFIDEPDLVIVDGGKGQLSAALEAMKEIGIAGIPTVGLAKREEEIFVPGKAKSICLGRDSDALKLMQRIRDEAHRFAITYHRTLRRKTMVESTLDKIQGVGGNRKRILLKHFGSPAAIADASLEELKTVPGLPGTVAERVYKHFNQQSSLD